MKDQSGQASVLLKTMDACRNAARILKQSGERLNLRGRWWKETSTATAPISETLNPAPLHIC
jgi:hypothetical protein